MVYPLHPSQFQVVYLCGAVLVALWLDRVWGEPPVRLHPVVWMGNYLNWAGQKLQRKALQAPDLRDWPSFLRGAAFWLLGVVVVGAVAFALEAGLAFLQGYLGDTWMGAWLGALVLALLTGFLLKPLFAWAMLRNEVLAVEQALSVGLEAGRERLSYLVSRDVSTLSEFAVRESAIESLAENLNDSVIAPLFWFVLLGLPGAAAYRFANTADAMWGYKGLYRGKNWEWAGKWAAVADDVLSWLPARITAVLLLLVSGCGSWVALRREAVRTPSPNSGWPMAAMALALGVQLCKPGVYVLHSKGSAPATQDTAQAVRFAGRTVQAFVVLMVAMYVGIAFAGVLAWAM